MSDKKTNFNALSNIIPSEYRLNQKWDYTVENFITKTTIGFITAGLFSFVLFSKILYSYLIYLYIFFYDMYSYLLIYSFKKAIN